MKPSYPLFVGLRYLRAKKRNRSISVNTLISVAGVALGVMALVTVLSVMTGFQDDLRRKILGVNAHVVVMQYTGKMSDYGMVLAESLQQEGVTAAAPFIIGQVMLSAGDKVHGVVLRGVDPQKEATTTDLLSNMKEGELAFGEGGDNNLPGLVIGRELSHILGVHVGDRVNMISPLGALGPMGMLPKAKGFRVTGIFEAGMFEYDANLAYIDIPHAQEFLNMGDSITGVELRLEDIYQAGNVAHRIQAVLGYPFHARDWMQMNRNLFAALKLEKIAMFLILTLIILVAAFNIVGTLVMMVIEKSRDIAILKTMGATRQGIMTIFMTQGLFVGVLGTSLGLIGGYVLCYILQETQLISLPGDVYYLDHLPVHMRVADFLWVGLAAIVISLLATVYPSLQAAKLDPIEPLRYE